MFIDYEPNIKATIVFLKLLGVKVNSTTISETLQNHPNWPSLLCISDSLTEWGVPNIVSQIQKSEIDQLPLPFIAYTKNYNNSLIIVTDSSPVSVTIYSNDYTRPKQVSKEEFLNLWGGLYLLTETNANSGDKNYKKIRIKALINSFTNLSASTLAIGIVLLIFQKRLNENNFANAPAGCTQLLLSIIGIFVTSLLLLNEIDRNSPLVKKICGGLIKTNCNAILASRQSKLLSWLSWSEIGFVYFTGSLFVLLFLPGYVHKSIIILGWLGLLAFPYSLFSVYYQWQIAKQWCILCLVVQILLVVGVINSYLSGLYHLEFYISIPDLIYTIGLFTLPGLLWFIIKPHILQTFSSKFINREYVRLKSDIDVFHTLLKKQTQLIPVNELGISIGNIQAKNVLIKVCNPYCGPCSKTHTQIEELLNICENLLVKIIFIIPEKNNDIAAKPALHIMSIAETKTMSLLKRALGDWYHSKNKNYNEFEKKWPINDNFLLQRQKLEEMSEWCAAMNITATPTLFFNGHELPDAYNLTDLKYFLLE